MYIGDIVWTCVALFPAGFAQVLMTTIVYRDFFIKIRCFDPNTPQRFISLYTFCKKVSISEITISICRLRPKNPTNKPPSNTLLIEEEMQVFSPSLSLKSVLTTNTYQQTTQYDSETHISYSSSSCPQEPPSRPSLTTHTCRRRIPAPRRTQ